MPDYREQICRDIEHVLRNAHSIGTEVAPVRGSGRENVYRIYYAHRVPPIDIDLGDTRRLFCAPPSDDVANGCPSDAPDDAYGKLAHAVSGRTNKARARWLVALEHDIEPLAATIVGKMVNLNSC